MKTLKYSRQRESIKDYLNGRTDHPTAEQVYNNVRKEYPNISLGTVYRNLGLLAETGYLTKISCGDASERFDPNTHEHYHFICTKCNCVYDLEMDNLDFINTLAGKDFDGKIEGHSTYFYGKCKNCK